MHIQLIVSNMACILSYLHKICCWKRFGIQGSNCTHSFQWCWYITDSIHEYPEHIHLYLHVYTLKNQIMLQLSNGLHAAISVLAHLIDLCM